MNQFWIAFLLYSFVASAFALFPAEAFGQQNPEQQKWVEAEIAKLSNLVPNFEVIDLSTTKRDLRIDQSSSLTVDDLRGIRFDPDPPRFKNSNVRGTKVNGPYVAKGILPFRLNYFNCEFNYGGQNNDRMQDYAVTHGFNTVAPYRRSESAIAGLPDGTRTLRWMARQDFENKGLKKLGVPPGRYDLLLRLNLAAMLKIGRPTGDQLMLDLEHPVLKRKQLRKKDWYPSLPGGRPNLQFESSYYQGYAKSIIELVRLAKRQGWSPVSVYGWAPFERSWLSWSRPDAAQEMRFAWDQYGKKIFEVVDAINNSVYCPYWDSRNVAFVLLNIDENLKLVNSTGVKKPVRPYFWPLIHGGGGGSRWWRHQPLSNEEQQAMIATSLFAGIDGIVVWNWSGTANHHLPDVYSFNGKQQLKDVMVARSFRMAIPGDNVEPEYEVFQRYDGLHVLDYNPRNDVIQFKKVHPKLKSHGNTNEFPTFSARLRDISRFLRPRSEPIAAVVEGLALVKPVEYTLRTGKPIIDVSAKRQFSKRLPIIRRVKNGQYHVVITYNPAAVYRRDNETEYVELTGIGREQLRKIAFPADRKTRIFVLKE